MQLVTNGAAYAVAAMLFLCLMAFGVDARVFRDVNYGSPAGEPLRLDVFVPDDGLARHPGILLLHGGCFSRGDKSIVEPLAKAFQAAGYTVANVNYRLAPRHPYPAALEDVGAALRFVADHGATYRVDPERIAAVGYSAGGTLAAYLGEGRQVAAVVSFSGRMDFLSGGSGTDCAAVFMGLPRTSANRAKFEAASPLTRLRRGDAPLFLAQGTADRKVPYLNAVEMVRQARALGIPARLEREPGVGHDMTFLARIHATEWLKALPAMRVPR